ncbi:uncharacterized protein LOC123296130 [Chrysoperla carnea]|uniref:uncharacterized protein LOC123296130 n=1 Tax=Chrysoperla carnea TaxID=189513 RepID=UPI001D068C6D|nr:uncharacterized protein LOC123296130 [Chrysoperla carnea]
MRIDRKNLVISFYNIIFISQIFAFKEQVDFTTVRSDLHGVVFQYFGKSHSEKFLPVCEKNAVCSIAHNRFWLIPLITRFCQCPSGFDCPWQIENDNFTMSLNNRSTLKYCEPVNNTLKTCKEGETAISVESYTINNKVQSNPPTAISTCYCPKNSYWKHTKRLEQSIGLNPAIRRIDYYKCLPLDMCFSDELCGYIHYNYSSVYYRCSCPENHLCINRDFNITYVNELFYQGDGLQAFCIKNPY